MKIKNEEKAVLEILKNSGEEYNANSLSKIINLSPMGTLKILKRLEKRGIFIRRRVSNIFFYKINFENSFAVDYVSLVLKSEAEGSTSYIKRWVNEIRKIKSASLAILFGSILSKWGKANDVDVLFVIERTKFNALKKEIEKLNLLNEKNIHPIFQTKEDLMENIKKRDKIVLEMIKGVVVFGEKDFVNILGGLK